MKVMICDGCGKKIDGIEQYLGYDLCPDCRSRINVFLLARDEYQRLKIAWNKSALFKQISSFEQYVNDNDLSGHVFISHYLEIGGSIDEIEYGKIKINNGRLAIDVEKN